MTSGTPTPFRAAGTRARSAPAGRIRGHQTRQAGPPTPCAGLDARTLVSHLAGADLRNFLASARGETPTGPRPTRRSATTGRRCSCTCCTAARGVALMDWLVVRGPGGEAPLRARAYERSPKPGDARLGPGQGHRAGPGRACRTGAGRACASPAAACCGPSSGGREGVRRGAGARRRAGLRPAGGLVRPDPGRTPG